ncbi:MAG: hypothetical protein WDO69_33365 [Pseudomonadota bacterium]
MLVAALSVATLSAAQAGAPRASLVVTRSEGAEGCPDAAALAEQIRIVAGANVIGSGPSVTPIETWVQVTISRNFGGYSAQISTSGTRHGTRLLEDLGPACTSLADAVAVTIAMILDPYPNSPSPIEEPVPIASQRVPKPKTPAVSAPAASARFFGDGSAGIAFNMLAHAQPFLGVGLGFQASARWSLALGGAFVLPDRTADGTPTVNLRLGYASLQGCARVLGDGDHVGLSWCAASQLGSLAGSGDGYQDDSSKRALWFALAVGPEAAFRLTRSFSWLLTGQGVIPLLEQEFYVQSDGARSSVFRSPSVAGLVSLGLRGHL